MSNTLPRTPRQHTTQFAIDGMRQIQRNFEATNIELSSRRFVGTAWDGQIVAVVTIAEGLVDLKIASAATVNPQLSNAVLSAVRQATASASSEYAKTVAPLHEKLAEIRESFTSI